MGSLEEYREIVKQIIREYSQFKPAYGNIEVETIFDAEEEHYELVHVGWKGVERIHGSVRKAHQRPKRAYGYSCGYKRRQNMDSARWY